jgi:hypothetical protein
MLDQRIRVGIIQAAIGRSPLDPIQPDRRVTTMGASFESLSVEREELRVIFCFEFAFVIAVILSG